MLLMHLVYKSVTGSNVDCVWLEFNTNKPALDMISLKSKVSERLSAPKVQCVLR